MVVRMSENAKRHIVLLACLATLVCLGTSAAWSVYVLPLMRQYGLSKVQTQLVPTLTTFAFCLWMIVSGRLYDRLGPRPVALLGAGILALAYFLAWVLPANMLWLSMGLLLGMGNATGYPCAIACAIKHFPRRRGLIAGLVAASYAMGPIIVASIARALLKADWPVLDVFGLIGLVYVPMLLAGGLAIKDPAPSTPHADKTAFSTRKFLQERRFWLLFLSMLCGTFPYLLAVGSLLPMSKAWFSEWVVALTIPALAGGNAIGRVIWGVLLDRVSPRKCMLAFQAVLVVTAAASVFSGGNWAVFLLCVMLTGFCYGTNFVTYPTMLARMYGPEVLGSTYPWVMLAQSISSMAPLVGGALWAATGGFQAGLGVAAGVAVLGLGLSAWLGHGQELSGQAALRIVQPLATGANVEAE